MHIGFEATAACRPVQTGIARYGNQLLQHLAHDGAARADRFTAFVRLSRRFKRGHRPRPVPGVRWRWYSDGLRPLGSKPDLMHGLELRVPRWAAGRQRPCVATMHDVFAQVSDELLNPAARERNRQRYQLMAEQCTRIISISERTKQDFLRFHDYDPQRIHVIHLGVDERFHPRDPEQAATVQRRLGLDGPFFLYVGDLTPRKNLVRLIAAFGASKASTWCDLAIAGARADGSEGAAAALRDCPARRRVHLLGYVDEEDLHALYSQAQALLYPTLYEGFGLPILEAFASGTPAVGGSVGAVPEVAGGHAVLADPGDVASIVAAIDRVVETTEAEIEVARLHARGFTWARCAQATRAVYRRCLQEETDSRGGR